MNFTVKVLTGLFILALCSAGMGASRQSTIEKLTEALRAHDLKTAKALIGEIPKGSSTEAQVNAFLNEKLRDSLNRWFNSDHYYDELLQAASPECRAKPLSDGEIVALRAYMAIAYIQMNQVFSSRDNELLNIWQVPVLLLQTALDKLPKFAGTVYHVTANNYADHIPGNRVTHNYFMSTTSDPQWAKSHRGNDRFGPASLFTIHSLTGHDVSACAYVPDEHEVLFSPGRSFLVKTKSSDPAGALIEMDELP